MSDDNQTKNSLLLFQLGPVQSFIAQAETLGDLAAGSTILSEITMGAVEKAKNKGAQLVFPNLAGNAKGDGIPNRFLAFVPLDKAEEIAKACDEAARGKLKSLAENVLIDADKKGAFNTQVERFLQITWAILKNPTGDMGKDYNAIGKLMAMRRNTREFDAWSEEGYGQKKDILSGKEVALQDDFGAMNLIKQSYAKKIEIPKTWKNYLAIIAMDGDKMGEKLGSFKKAQQHFDFSGNLTKFAGEVRSYFKDEVEEKGLSVYAGGDDVLAVVSAKKAIEIAQDLRKKFKDIVGNNASAGIAIGHSSVPLQDLVHAAHDAESRAKKTYGRNALAISIYKRSGEILEWGCGWDSPALDIYEELTALSKENEEGKISIGRFPYKLAALLQSYELKGEVDGAMLPIVMAEYDHAVEQTKDMRKDKVDRLSRDKVKAYLKDCFEKKPEDVKEQEKKKSAGRAEDFLNLFMAETFINRPREEEE